MIKELRQELNFFLKYINLKIRILYLASVQCSKQKNKVTIENRRYLKCWAFPSKNEPMNEIYKKIKLFFCILDLKMLVFEFEKLIKRKYLVQEHLQSIDNVWCLLYNRQGLWSRNLFFTQMFSPSISFKRNTLIKNPYFKKFSSINLKLVMNRTIIPKFMNPKKKRVNYIFKKKKNL